MPATRKSSMITGELYSEWKDTVIYALDSLGLTQQKLADACSVCRGLVSHMLNNKQKRLTGLQFLGTMHALAQMAVESEKDIDLVDHILQKIDDCNKMYFYRIKEV